MRTCSIVRKFRHSAGSLRSEGSLSPPRIPIYEDVLQLRSSKQDRADLFYSEAFIYGPFSDVALDSNCSKTIVETHLPGQFQVVW